MEGRITIRYSLDGERNGALRNFVNKILEESGFERTQTGTIELGSRLEPEELPVNKILEVLGYLLEPESAPINHTAELDHLWIYIDKGT